MNLKNIVSFATKEEEMLKEYEKYAKIFFPLIAVIGLCTYIYFFNWTAEWWVFLLISGIVWLYMAMNIGANDIANNMGPAVWSKAITLIGAIFIAAIFEAAWAIIAGWDVVETIKWGIITADGIIDNKGFIYMMLAALLGSALWINIATIVKAPVSATHSVIGWVVWAWIVAYGTKVVEWESLWKIAVSWVLSPILWGIISAIIFYSLSITIFKRKNMIKAAKWWIPFYISLMSFSFTIYLITKWLKKIAHINMWQTLILAIIIGFVTFEIMKFYLQKKLKNAKNDKKVINGLFAFPLVFSAALLSFAHGSNDVANAIGPLAAINDIIIHNAINGQASIPLWIMLTGAVGLSLWLGIFWARLIKTVGTEITKLNQSRAYSVALSTALTVIIASTFGIPVSSTHIAIGWVFWIGLMREWLKRANGKDKIYVQRSLLKSILMAWIITLPASAWIAWIINLLLINIF